jgi:hypothetical protein
VTNASKKDTENVDASVVQAEVDKLEESEIKKTFIEINDKVCNDQEYEKSLLENEVTSLCSIEVYPAKYNLDRLEGFRNKVKEYFEKRTDVVKWVEKCEVENYGSNVKLVTEERRGVGFSSLMIHRETLMI